jgi:glycosyltransferase involved in cell wall biosynthesis
MLTTAVSKAQARSRTLRPPTPAPKVLIVAPQPFFQERGTPIAVRHVVECLSELGFGVDILTYPLGQSPEIPNVRYFRVPNHLRFRRVPIGFSWRKVWLDLFLWRELRRLVRSGEYVCIHAVEEAAFFGVLVARRHGVPLVYDMQSSVPEQLQDHSLLGMRPIRWFIQRCERWVVRTADRVACSAGLDERVRSLAPEAHVLPWTFPGTYQQNAIQFRAALRAELGIRQDQPVVVYTGNFADYQGLAELVEAIHLVRAEHPKVVFMFVGASTEESGAVGRRLQASIPAESFRLVRRQPASHMPRYLAAADIAVSPRQRGSNLPLKVIEYLAAGLPIVATRIRAHTVLLQDETAVLVSREPEGLAKGIVALLDDPDMRQAYRSAATAYAARHLGPAAFLLSLAHLYDNIDGVGLPYMGSFPPP